MQLREGKYGGVRDRKTEEKGKQGDNSWEKEREGGRQEDKERRTRVRIQKLLGNEVFKNHLRRIRPLPVTSVTGSGWPVWPLQARHQHDRSWENTPFSS